METPLTYYVAVPGTWATRRSAEWSEDRSAFSKFMQGHYCYNMSGKASSPYYWSTDLDLSGGHQDWRAGGAALTYYIAPPLFPSHRYPPADTNLIVHSHGLQVALYACAAGLQINCLVSVSSPVREDMASIATRARKNIGYWLHIHSDWSDRWQWFGTLLDGKFGITREHPLADRNEEVEAAGHGGVLMDPNFFHLWYQRGWGGVLRKVYV